MDTEQRNLIGDFEPQLAINRQRQALPGSARDTSPHVHPLFGARTDLITLGTDKHERQWPPPKHPPKVFDKIADFLDSLY